jgi:SPASM domain peptide maturase of grasp-with-spasm system
VKAVYGPSAAGVVDEYFAFLDEHELGFWTEEPESFPELDRTWQTPEVITNAIVDVDAASGHDYDEIVRQLAELGCKALQLRFFSPMALDEVDRLLRPTMYGPLRAIELLLPHTDECTPARLWALAATHRRISNVVVHTAPEETVQRSPSGDRVPLFYRRQAITSHTHCGEVHPAYFAISQRPFLESMQFNSCLNRKISVDVRGEIRNCPSLPETYGNMATTTLHAAVMQERFRDVWEVNKDQVAVCRDCEFRYVCTDCRAWVQDPSDPASKPAKCAYDPYTAQWSGAA